jgi:hypothetical protein
MRSSPITSPCSQPTFPGTHTLSPGIAQRLWRRLVEHTALSSSSTRIFRLYWMNWACRGFPAYIPKRNYQNAIFGAIDRYLSRYREILEFVPKDKSASAVQATVFVEPPALRASESAPTALRRLVRKFDPVERDHLNRSLGKAGEAFVIDVERRKLADGKREDLARKVRWVADEDGDGAGYDVLSFNSGGTEKLIEVKTTNGSARTPFFLSRNERELATERPADWRIYRVHCFAKEARIFTIEPPLENAVKLMPETWRCSF